MTRDEIVTEAQNRISDADAVIASAAQVQGWVNQGVRAVARAWNWPFLRIRSTIALTTGSTTFALPADFGKIEKVAYDDGSGNLIPVAPVPDRWMQDNYYSSSATGAPEMYTPAGLAAGTPPLQSIRVVPKADQNYTMTVTYQRVPPKITSGTVYPLLPEEFDEAVILWVMRQYYRQVEDEIMVADKDRAYKEEVQSLVLNYGNWQYEGFSHLRATNDLTDDYPYL